MKRVDEEPTPEAIEAALTQDPFTAGTKSKIF